jgi:hypothetical protein
MELLICLDIPFLGPIEFVVVARSYYNSVVNSNLLFVKKGYVKELLRNVEYFVLVDGRVLVNSTIDQYVFFFETYTDFESMYFSRKITAFFFLFEKFNFDFELLIKEKFYYFVLIENDSFNLLMDKSVYTLEAKIPNYTVEQLEDCSVISYFRKISNNGIYQCCWYPSVEAHDFFFNQNY